MSNIFLNIGTAISDCQIARRAWLVDNYADCLVLINAAIAQLESDRAKIEKETKRNDNRAVLNAVVGSFPDLPDCTDPFKERYIRDTEERACEAGSCKQNNESPKPKTDTTQPTAQPTVEPTVPGWYWVELPLTRSFILEISKEDIERKYILVQLGGGGKEVVPFKKIKFSGPIQPPEGWEE